MATTPPRKSKRKTNWSKVFIIGLIGLALLAFILQSIPDSGRSRPASTQPNTAETAPPPPSDVPRFIDMGDLTITDGKTGEQLAKIDVEYAQNDREIAQGLMFREEMDENQGMLFFMERLEPQSFWMRNTLIPLDIIFLDDKQEIIHIAANTQTESDDPIPSGGPALYVLEVNAGFAERHGLQVGDQMAW